jgi:serine/threonine protein kinase
MASDPVDVQALFEAAARLSDPSERTAFLERECADAQLRSRVEALLGAGEAPGDRTGEYAPTNAVDHSQSPLARTGEYAAPDGTVTFGSDHVSSAEPKASEGAGAVVGGKYTLVEPIGEGGMGSVWRAQQTEPVKRFVAVKLIKAGMDSKSVLARFDAERQALALMDHPSIARIYDGGVTTLGQPYFVMELVAGVPLTEYCDSKRLSIEARLQLFVQVCNAIQHAHQKGIIHRDLKPGNVLVTEVDARPTPKVIDFGVAKATEQRLTDMSLNEENVIVGTPAYMSPEQADPTSSDIDTRTDVYALGVMLYELLTGTQPLEAKQFKRGALLEMLRMVREVDPPRPSTRLKGLDTLATIAESRDIEPTKLAKLLHGELDWVVMRALEKDRTRRYDTANALANDVQRYLADEMVEARPPSRGYRLQKFVKRNKGQVIAAALGLLALVAGVIGTTWGMLRANEQRQIAEYNERQALQARQAEAIEKEKALKAAEAEKEANDRAQKRLVQTEKANDILGAIVDSLDPREILQTKRPLQEILVRNLESAVKQLDGEAIGDPLVVARLQMKFGKSLLGLGETAKAITLLEKARATFRDSLGANHHFTQVVSDSLGTAYQSGGRSKDALALLEESLRGAEALWGTKDAETLRAMNNLAIAYRNAGEYEKAIPLQEKTLDLRKKTLGNNHPDTIRSMQNLAIAYAKTDQPKKALPLMEQAYTLTKNRNNFVDLDTLEVTENLGALYFQQSRYDLAIPIFEDCVKFRQTKLGRDHPDTIWRSGDLGVNYLEVGRIDEAIPLLAAAFAEVHHNPRLLYLGARLIEAYVRADQPDKAAATQKTYFQLQRKAVAADAPVLALRLSLLGLVYLKKRAYAEAEPLLRESLTIREKKEPESWTTFNTQSALGGALMGQKKYAEAEPLLVKGYLGLKMREDKIPPQAATRIPEALDRLIDLYTQTKKPDEVKKYQQLRAKYPKGEVTKEKK